MVHKPCDDIKRGRGVGAVQSDDRSCRLQRESPAKHGELGQGLLFPGREQLPGFLQGAPQGQTLFLGRVEQSEAILQPGTDVFQRQLPGLGCRQLDGQWEPLQSLSDLCHQRFGLGRAHQLWGPGEEEFTGLFDGERLELEHLLHAEVKGLSGAHQHRQLGGEVQPGLDGVPAVLAVAVEVVQDQQARSSDGQGMAEFIDDRRGFLHVAEWHLEVAGDGREHLRPVPCTGQRADPAVTVYGQLYAQATLATARHALDGHQAMLADQGSQG